MNRYATTLRPATGGGLPPSITAWNYVEAPQDGRTYYGADGMSVRSSRYRYGVIETATTLTHAEMQHFDIVEVT
jgi:hypothetical protein